MAQSRKTVNWRNFLEVFGEIVLLSIVGGFFVYLVVLSLHWPLGAALMPRIAVAIGTPFLIIRIVTLLRRQISVRNQVMDMGFRVGFENKEETRRLIRIILYIAGLYLGIWIFGMQVALPLGLFFYLMVYGKAGWIVSTVVAGLFLALIFGVYDNVLHADWHEPLILQLWNGGSS